MSEASLAPAASPRRALRASIFLIGVECLMLGYPSGNWLVTGGLFLWVVSRWWTIRRGWCLNVPVFWNSLFLAVAFVIKYTFLPAKFSTNADFVNTTLAHEVGCWLVSLQILILHETSSTKRIRPIVAALGCVVVLCAGDLRLLSMSRNSMQALILLFVGGLAWFAHAGRDWIRIDQRRRLRRGIMLATLLLAAVPTILAARAWNEHERDLETFLIRMMQAMDGSLREPRARVRSALLQVSNGKIVEPEKLVLRVTQDSPDPLYLRGAVFNSYPDRSSAWMNQSNPFDLLPATAPADLRLESNEYLFQLTPSAEEPWTTATITYLSKDDPVPLAPLHTGMMKIAVSQLRTDHLTNLLLQEEGLPDTLTDYVPVTPGLDQPPGFHDEERLFPSKIDPRILAIADSIFLGKRTDSEKIGAVESFFHDNFLYQLGYEPPLQVDPLTDFLVNRRPAHCEYFASGASILLRIGGVPSRYVTGYVPSEQHAPGVWLARRKDAHAWVEAYDSELQRWVTVEPTPSEGLPERRTATWRNAIQEVWRIWSTKVHEQISQFGVWTTIVMALQSTIVRVILGVLLIAGWVGFVRRYRRNAIAQRDTSLPKIFPFQEWLSALETTLDRRGFKRLPHETLLQFRDRILASPQGPELQSTAEWYATYSSIRYNETEQTEARVAELELSWQSLTSKISRA